jgi:hypothetical protein
VLTSALTVVLGLAGAATLGAAGTIEGAAVAAWTGALLYQWQLHIALRESAATTDNAPATPRRLAGRHRRDADGARLENQVVPDASLSGESAG